jgi:hypothetical protein
MKKSVGSGMEKSVGSGINIPGPQQWSCGKTVEFTLRYGCLILRGGGGFNIPDPQQWTCGKTLEFTVLYGTGA